MSREKQIEEMAKALTKYEKGLCERLQKDKCLLTSAIHAQVSCDYCKIAEFLYNAGYRKQEWISIDERLPEDVYDKDRKIITVLVCTKSGRVSTSSRVRMMMLNKEKRDFEYTDIFEWSGQIAKKITHWMPLPEPPKMKGESKDA